MELWASVFNAIDNFETHGGWEYEWGSERQLVRRTQNEKAASYNYDYNVMRIRQTVSNKTVGGVYATYECLEKKVYCHQKSRHCILMSVCP